ncbi:NAD(P)-binding protein [Mycena olivaceomarginata]|nr:NAD(P)-binding protein [Mycena olivaceomarginata]
MPAVTSGKVLVSGANGFIAVWVKAAHLHETFASYGDKFELIVVPDITQEGAFDEAVKGVDEPDELIRPAIHGTVGILQSALKHGTSVKRVVVTSSCAAVLQAPKEVAELGRAAPAITKYRASKTLAERGVFSNITPPASCLGLFEKHKNEIGWGPRRPQPSIRIWGMNRPPRPAHTGSCWIDVRDLGRAHVLALLKAQAGGERIILDAAPHSPHGKYQKGVPGAGKDAVHQIRYDASKSVRVLGMKYRTMAETARDTAADWEARGW